MGADSYNDGKVRQKTATVYALEAVSRDHVAGSHVNAGASQHAGRCSGCSLRDMCLPSGMADDHLDDVGDLVYTHLRLRRGDSLFRAGDVFNSLYAIRTGSFKAVSRMADGRDQVTGFSMAGELLGMDAIAPERHGCDVAALEDSEVCVIPYARLIELCASVNEFQRQFHKIMSREIEREHGIMLLLGTMRADERLAIFLLNMSQRLVARGYSATEFVMRMSREEIGSYLGLKLETVSRMFSKLQDAGFIKVVQKHVHILDMTGLKRSIGRSTD